MKLKRSLCTLLSIVMILSCILSAGYSTVYAQNMPEGVPNHKDTFCFWEVVGYNTVVIRLNEKDLEDKAYAYVWDNSYKDLIQWPGVEMTLGYEEYGYKYFYAYIPEEYNKVVFSTDKKIQTVEFDFFESFGTYLQHPEDVYFPEYKYEPCFHPYGDETEILPILMTGDVDGNNVVNIKDATAIQKAVAGIDAGTYIESLADVDKNGTVNIKDATAIQKRVAGITADADIT